MTDLTSKNSTEEMRREFEIDAKPYGFVLDRKYCAAPKPWSEYAYTDTGHRWAGWQAAIASKQKELSQANATIAALKAKIAEANKKAEAESDWYICSELPDGRLQYTQDNADEHAVQLFTRPPITSQRELELQVRFEEVKSIANRLAIEVDAHRRGVGISYTKNDDPLKLFNEAKNVDN